MNPAHGQNPMPMRQGAIPQNSAQQNPVIQGLTPQQILQAQAAQAAQVQAAQAAQAAQFSGTPVINGSSQMVSTGSRVVGKV